MLAQVLAIIIFLAMFLLIILEIWERQWITLACGLLTLLLVFGLGYAQHGGDACVPEFTEFLYQPDSGMQQVNPAEASSGINWQTIIFIAGMMIMVEGYGKSRFLPLALHGNRKEW